jgi:pimeloyl-ACP methyl ester carboxylesterase
MSAPDYTTLPSALSAPRKRFKSIDAGNISYYESETDSGRPLVLLHSVNAAPSAMEMKPLFEHYRGQRKVFAPDLPGFGFSERGDRPYSPALYAAAIAGFLESVVKREADVIALSTTAEFAARAVPQVAGLIASLAVISPTGLGSREPPAAATAERLQRAFSLPLFGQSLYRLLTCKASIRYFLNLNFVGKAPDELIDYAYATSHQSGARFAPFAFLSMKLFSPRARTALYEPLQIPALVLYDTDPNVSFSCLPQLLRANHHWRAARIQPSRGLPHWERLEETCAALEQFWDAVDGHRNAATA